MGKRKWKPDQFVLGPNEVVVMGLNTKINHDLCASNSKDTPENPVNRLCAFGNK